MTKEAVMISSTQIFRGCCALAFVLLAACATTPNGPQDALSVTERFPITVEPHMEALRLAYNGPRGALSDMSQAELEGFAHDYLENGSGSIAVSPSRRYPDAAADATARLVSLGVPRDRILPDTANLGDDVRISFVRYQAHAEPCGDWSVNLAMTSANQVSPNFGCATQHNLAAMVADPRDLVSPKPLESGDAQRRLTVLDKYRKGETTVATKTPEQSGAVSDVGGTK
jgi:pilus assembly protein CpaD